MLKKLWPATFCGQCPSSMLTWSSLQIHIDLIACCSDIMHEVIFFHQLNVQSCLFLLGRWFGISKALGLSAVFCISRTYITLTNVMISSLLSGKNRKTVKSLLFTDILRWMCNCVKPWIATKAFMLQVLYEMWDKQVNWPYSVTFSWTTCGSAVFPGLRRSAPSCSASLSNHTKQMIG